MSIVTQNRLTPANGLHGHLVDAIGTTSLGHVLFSAAAECAGVSELFAFYVDDAGTPIPVVSNGRSRSAATRGALYAADFHAADPLFPRLLMTRDGAPTQTHNLNADEIPQSPYRQTCFDRARIATKQVFVSRRSTRLLVLSFYWTDAHHNGRSAARGLAEMAMPIIRKHAEFCSDDVTQPLLVRIEDRLVRGCPELTARERAVCARTMIGMTAEAIAIDLGIASSTVLTYRRRAYDRFGISNANQLLPFVID